MNKQNTKALPFKREPLTGLQLVRQQKIDLRQVMRDRRKERKRQDRLRTKIGHLEKCVIE
jgi:hypothetical protein